MTVAYIGPVLRLMERFKFLDYQDCPLKSGSSIIDLFAAKAGEVTARVTIAIRNIRILFISRWVL